MTRTALSSICASILLSACAVERGDQADAGLVEPEPTPEFLVWGVHGALAIDDAGIREYRLDGQARTSSLIFSLYKEGVPGEETCNVRVPAVFVGFAQRTMSERAFSVVQLDPGQGILGDGCGWDDAYVQAELAALGPIEIGWARPGVAEDWPNLDVMYGVGAGAPVAYRGAGTGLVMDADGIVSNEPVNLFTTALDRGLYEF